MDMDAGDPNESFAALFEESLKREDVKEGDIVRGRVIQVAKDYVVVDIGYKSEGVIPSKELSIRNDVDPSEIVSLGESVEALVLTKEDKEGRLVLSRKRAEFTRTWQRIVEVNRDKKVVWEFKDHAHFKTINQIQLLDISGDVTRGEIHR